MVLVGEGAAIQVVNQSAGALVTALAGAEHGGHGVAVVGVQSRNSIEEVLGGPGVGVQVHILQGAGLLKGVLVDGHAVSGHDQGILVDSALAGHAGGQSGGIDLGLVGVVQQVGQVHHVALGAPVGNQTLGTFHDQVGSLAGGDGGVDLVVAVSVGQVFHGDLDAGLGLESVGQFLDGVLIAPAADGVGPEGDAGGVRSGFLSISALSGSGLFLLGTAAGGQRKDHRKSQSNRKKSSHLLHVSSS